MKKLTTLINLLFCLAFVNSTQAQITGVAYRDYNGNGTRQTVAPTIEPGVSGIVVTAYNALDVLVNTTTTAVDGTYSLAYTVPVRLEFTIPSGSGCVSNAIDHNSFSGDGNSVRFVSASGAQNFAINNPADYIASTNPSVFVNQYANGNPLVAGTSQNASWFVGFPYNTTGTSAPPQILSGAAATIGCTWGIAYSKQAQKIFTSAFVKRHVGLGVMGSGGIYMLTPTAGSFTVNNFYDMDAPVNGGAYRTRADAGSAPAYGSGTSYTLNNGGTNSTQVTYLGANDAASGAPLGFGVIGTNVQRGLVANFATQSNDPAAFDQVGKVGLGDLEISDDGRYLFVVNLYDRRVYRLTLNDAYNPTSVTAVTSYALPNPPLRSTLTGYGSVPNNSGHSYSSTDYFDGTYGYQRAFALKYSRGKLYVGAGTTGENGGVHVLENNVGTPEFTDLWTFVYELDNPTAAASFNTTPTFYYPLNYNKGATITWTTPDYALQWYPWTRNTGVTVGQTNDRTYPQPMLSDIEFSDKGDLLLAYTDRGGHQFGWWNYRDLSGTTPIGYPIGGDLLVAGKSCATGNYTMEFNGAYTNNGTSYNSGAANNDGPGNSEFFKNDELAGTHEETVFGSLAVLPGSNSVMLTYMDPNNAVRTGGTAKFSMVDGSKGVDYQLYLSANNMSTGTLGKAGGLGDIELLGSLPGIEIGNRIWNDANGDGVQSAGEAGINGATISLYSNGPDLIPGTADDIFLGSTTSDASGEWYFNAANITDGNPTTAGNQPGPQPNYNYNVRTVVPTGYQLTKRDKQGSGAFDLSDNDALFSPLGVPMIVITTGSEGHNNHSFDFGFKPLASLGDKVWLDNGIGGGTAADGMQNGTEPGVAGLSVTLFNNAGSVIGYTTTDAYGNYLFDNLAAGNYTVGFTLPANYTFATQTNVADDGNTTGNGATSASINGSDVNQTTGRTYTIVLSAGENNRNIDAGLIYTLPTTVTQSVGDRVWYDNGAGGGTAADGTQNGTEPGVAGVNVTLYNAAGTAIAAAITDANGYYLFTNVAVGSNYSIGFSRPVGMVFSPNVGALSVTTNSDANATTGRTANFNIASGNNFTYVDAGIYPQPTTRASVGDRVWEDTNQDGLQNSNEPGIGGVTVNLYQGATLIATTNTDAFGYYMFTNVVPGNYTIEFIKPVTHTISPRKVGGGTSATDSDPYPGTGITSVINLQAGDRNTAIDAGMYRTTTPGVLKIGDKVWNDYNKNGIQEANEPGIAGITITLYQNGADGLPGTADDVVIGTTFTDADGNYIFVNLAASAGASTNYNLKFDNVPVGFVFSLPTAPGSITSNDSNPFSSGRTGSINLTVNNFTIDGGITTGIPAGKGSLGDKVWYDLNNNGIQDAGELGVSAVTVTLQKDINGDGVFSGGAETAFASTSTNALGQYMFGGLDAATYRVVFSNMPVGYIIGIRNAVAANYETDSDGDNAGVTIAGATTSTTGNYILADGENNLSADLAILQPANRNTLGDFVWYDQNSDGLQTAGEPGLAGVMVTLFNNAGTAIAYTSTDANGQYLFTGLADGNYSVGFTNMPAGFDYTSKSVSNDLTGSDADILSGRTATVTLNFAAGGTSRDNRSLDGGLLSTRASLGDYVWLDNNGDGVQNAGEKGISGATVILYASDGTTVLASCITDQNGKYSFANLMPGSYIVGFGTTPSNLEFTQQNTPGDNGNNTNSEANPATGRSVVFVLSASEADMTLDAGIRGIPVATVGDYVWSDLDVNGIQDPGEPGIGGMTVTLFNNLNQPIGSAITNGDGKYLITNVPPGTGYYVVFGNMPNNPTGIQPSFTLQGGSGGTNTSHANAGGVSNTFTVNAGDNITNIDAGIRDYPGRSVLAAQQFDIYATQRGSIVTISWLTKNEVNTDKFVVERSVDNSNFTAIGEKAAAGTYSGTSNYALNDDIISLNSYPVIYYRVKLLNIDGGFQYSKVVAVRVNSQVSLKIWPNPFVENITISLTSTIATVLTIRVMDYSGKTILFNKQNIVKGINQLKQDDIAGLPKGIYIMELTDPTGLINTREKITKQ